ncbi:DUF6526 family protein [Solitalea koreensis]|uniref:Uncharacterized protein n=1 Tax=Solitalea koreensis TaxID=543615 RepID=A0A521BN14_9SPHI|nr:DUF6526 family protein [Solitalea koreensis]SMO48000.1 hypothetical protein SAMN06265350_102308 [Solitalea koreensis]
MKNQNYANHSRMVPGFHYVLLFLLIAGLIGSIINLFNSVQDHSNLYSASLIALLFICAGLSYYYTRSFPLRAQDRAIRAEENLRHYILAGKPLDSRLRMGQIIALRFAGDEEFVALASRAAEQGLNSDEIKKEIKNWKIDHNRV